MPVTKTKHFVRALYKIPHVCLSVHTDIRIPTIYWYSKELNQFGTVTQLMAHWYFMEAYFQKQ